LEFFCHENENEKIDNNSNVSNDVSNASNTDFFLGFNFFGSVYGFILDLFEFENR